MQYAWSTYDPDLIKQFHAIYLHDIEQVQTCLEQNHVKCHLLCDLSPVEHRSQAHKRWLLT